MARHLAPGLCVATLVAALVLAGCDEPPTVGVERSLPSRTARVAASDAAISGASQEPSDDPPPWLAELLHSPDFDARIQALDQWERQPGMALDPVTYLLVDPDESVRARAQEVFEAELARR